MAGTMPHFGVGRWWLYGVTTMRCRHEVHLGLFQGPQTSQSLGSVILWKWLSHCLCPKGKMGSIFCYTVLMSEYGLGALGERETE